MISDIRRSARLLPGLVLLASLVAAPSTAGAVTTVQVATGSAHGQAIQVNTPLVPDPDDPTTTFPTRGDISRSEAGMDTGGFGAGELVADGFAVVVKGDTPGVENAESARADTHFPSQENDCDPAAPDPACDEGTLAEGQVAGLLAATVLGSTSRATSSESTNQAEAANAEVAGSGTLPEVVATTVEGDAGVEQSAPDPSPVTDADAFASQADVRVGDESSPILTAELIQTTADAIATGDGGSTAETTCKILDLTVLGTNLGDVDCDEVDDVEVACGGTLDTPGVRVAFNVLDPDPATASDDLAEAGVTAVVVEITEPDGTGGCVATHSILLSQAHARSARLLEEVDENTVCGSTVADPTASGSALGEVLRVNDPNDPPGSGLLELSAARSTAEFDEAGLPEDPDVEPAGANGARAAGLPALLQALNAPATGPPSFTDPSVLAEVVDSHAQAPLAGNENHTLASLDESFPPPTGLDKVAAEVVSSSAEAATDPDEAENFKNGSAAATTSIDTVDVVSDPATLGLPVSVDLDQIQSSASSQDTGTSTVSTAGENLTTLDSTVDGVDIHAELIVTKDDDLGGDGTTAVANGAPGGAAVDTTFTIAELVVAGTDVTTLAPDILTEDTDGDGNPGPATLDITVDGVTVATVFIGLVDSDVDPDGTFADIVVDPVVVQIPGDASAEEPDPDSTLVRLGHTEAHAVFPDADGITSMVATKDVDIHFDAASFGDDGELIAPHQKFWYGFCVGNDGTETLTDVSLSDDLDDRLRIVQESNEPEGGDDGIFTALADWTIVDAAGKVIETKDPFTLEPGQEATFTILVEADAREVEEGDVIDNLAVGSADELADDVPSNTVTNTVGFADDRPATFLRVLDRETEDIPDNGRLLTFTLELVNQGKGTAFGARVDLVSVREPDCVTEQTDWTLLTELPITLGDVPAGSTSDAFEVEFEIPDETQQFCLIFRERAEDAEGNPFGFDTFQQQGEARPGRTPATPRTERNGT